MNFLKWFMAMNLIVQYQLNMCENRDLGVCLPCKLKISIVVALLIVLYFVDHHIKPQVDSF